MNQRNGYNASLADRPDWVICGIPWDGKVAILASTELDRAELEAQRDIFDPIDPYDFTEPIRLSPTRYTLTVQMRQFVLVVADTYEQAFRSLFEQWTPQRTDHAQLGASRREVTS